MSSEEPNEGLLRVLIVEHDAADAELCVFELQKAGFMVEADVVGTPDEFAARLRAKPYDVILADYRLPNWTGMEALRALQDAGLDIPFILVTGTLGDERAVDSVKQGAADYVIKHNMARLSIAVRRALGDKLLRDERKQSEGLIRKLRLAVDQSPASVLITDTTGRIEYVNQRFTQVTGYTQSEVLGKSPRLLKSGRTSPNAYHELWTTIRSGGVWHGEVLNRRKNGDLFWDDVTIAPIRDANDQVTHFVATQEDITERKHAEHMLRDREERFGQLAENIREVFFVMDAQFRETLYINPAYEEIWGRSCQSLYDDPSSFLDAVPEEDRQRLVDGIIRNQHGEATRDLDFRVVRPDGDVRWVLAHSVPIRDARGEVYRISGVAMDVTERRRAEEALALSEARYRTLTEASFDGIAITEDGIVREANRGYAEILGYDLIEVIGRHATDFAAEASLDEVQRRMGEEIDGTYETVGKRKDGKEVILEATAKTLVTGGKRERVTALRDITEKRQLENQFRQAQKMEAVGRLAGGVAHDFNNLLTVMISYAELLLREADLRKESRSDIEQILKAAEGAAVLTHQLLAFSRQQVIQPRPIVLERVVESAEKLLRRAVGEDIQLETALSAQHLTVVLDPGQLEQVLMNLVVNARDAMPTGGKITIESSAVSFDETYARTHWPATLGQFAMLSVTDTGIGMDKETQARIFEPFFTTKATGKGTGLGLAMVYGIVKQSGGFVWVYSEPGKGTTFKLYFPLAAEPATKLDEMPAQQEAPRGTETLLLVEDSAAVRRVALEILRLHGYNVIEAPGSLDALEFARKHDGPIHLLVTDVVMPELSGSELAAKLAASRPEMRVLYMSGYADDAVTRHGFLAPGNAYIQKPFTPDALAFKVREVLDIRRASETPLRAQAVPSKERKPRKEPGRRRK